MPFTEINLASELVAILTANSGKSSGDSDGAGSAATLLGSGGLLASSPSKDTKSMMDPDLVLASTSNLENQVNASSKWYFA